VPKAEAEAPEGTDEARHVAILSISVSAE
jgi:hypothetical protein